MKDRKIDIAFLFISIAIGLTVGFVLEVLFESVLDYIDNRIIYVTVFVVILVLVMSIVLLFKGLSNGTFVNFGKVIALTLAAFVVFVGCSALFEYLYELDGGPETASKSSKIQYVFLIDDSGSMYNPNGNDGNGQRFSSVEAIIKDMKPTKNFAVYVFASSTECCTPMGTTDSKNYVFDRDFPKVGGGTEMMTAIDDVIDEVCNKKGVHTKVIVLTDGIPGDSHLFENVVARCSGKNVSVSSVGFGSPDNNFLKELADRTGGTYVFSDNLSGLTGNIDQVVKAKVKGVTKDRDLLSARNDYTSDSFWYGFLRVLFLILMGALWTVIKMLLVGEKKFTQVATVLSIGLCVLAALVCELLFLLDAPGGMVRILFCGLWTCTLIPKKVIEKVVLGNSLYVENKAGNGNARDLFDGFNNNGQGGGGSKSFL